MATLCKPAPSRFALERAHRFLKLTLPLDQALERTAFRLILENVARGPKLCPTRLDVKKLQANDHD
ncbi:hypothetical protein SAMN06265795_12220 [Noviherbaspirillum humi]|uniref:Uncharacterized protein n=1 Tax=Noviherbaspirillum humi TaxID=1688639 RepID=A0A239LEA0_9BURK|nr:hypothetical protein [Noviherbaspirillum humi]SNT28655.1 hypothetical protein SAMN06265795_12220 [Noviherbaspirillum humi]